jgi:hypothetical protein
MAEVGGRNDIEIEVPLLRHMIINSIRGYKQKFGEKYGELVIACDNYNYWRREEFSYYKAGRKKAREDSGFDWKVIFEALSMIRDELNDYFPYKVINVQGAEADDIIAVLAEWSQTNDLTSGLFDEPKPFLVLSGDHDFIQLQKWNNVQQYSPILKKFINEPLPAVQLKQMIIRGDKGDGIPNILTQDNVFVEGGRQRPITEAKIINWLNQNPEEFCNDEMFRNYKRNELLIDLTKVPETLQKSIIDTYETSSGNPKQKFMNYMIANKLKNLLEVIHEF